MANSIKGITIEIGGDTTGLDKALKSTNTEIRSTQSELKSVERLLKLDPTNTELLKQKQELLNKSVGETSDKLKTLKTAEAQAQQQFKEGKISQEQYNALQREIISTEQSLKSLKSEAANSNVALQKIGATAGEVADKTKGLSMAAGGALLAVGAAAVKAGQSADELNTLSKQTGITTAELQKMQYASELVDVSTETITGSMRKMKKNMDSDSKDVQEAWQRIGVSTTDATGQMKPATDVFYETIEALSKVGNETERDQLAMQIFGKSADELAGVIDDGGASLKQLGQEAEDAGLIMSQDALDGANEFNDGIDKLKATASASFGKIAGSLSKTLIPMLEKLSTVISNVLNVLSNLSPTTQKIILTVVALVAAISPIAKLIQGITVITGALTAAKAAHTAATVAETAATAAGTAAQTGLNLAFLACPITWIIAAIAALVAAFVVLWNKCEGFRNFWKGLWNDIVYGLKIALYGIEVGVISMVNFIINCLNGMIKGILNPLNLLIEGLNLIPGVNIKKIKLEIPKIALPEMPKMAKGGTLFTGSAIVGEAGPELLTQMGNRTQVTPLTDSQSASAISKITNNYGARQQVNVFSVGNQEVARVIQPTISVGSANQTYGRRRAGYAH